MSSLTRLSVRRPVATVMVYLAITVVGLVSFRSLPVDLLPSIEFTRMTVRVRYPNVGPREVEQIITTPIENAVSGLPNLRRVRSRSAEGVGYVSLDFARGTNVDEAANDLRAALDQVRLQLPLEASPPEILKLDLDREEVVSLAATSTRDLETLTRLLERDMARRLKQIAGVGTIEITGGVYREIQVGLKRDRLNALGLTALDVQRALAQENVALPGGNVKSGVRDLYVRPLSGYESLDQIRRTVVANLPGGPVRVEDVAEVRDGHREVQGLVEINGVPSVGLGVQKQSGANTVEVAERVREEVDRINAERQDLHLTVIADQSELIRQSIDSVRDSALQGSLLAIVVLYLFLRRRSTTAIIAVSIPISIISTFTLLYLGGLTLNQMTFGGLALGVGMIVDNSIVVLESIVRKREEEGLSGLAAADQGTSEVAGAIVASTLTTCVIFLPVVFTSTVSGALFRTLALVVVFSLGCSLLVALSLVPMLAGRMVSGRRVGNKAGKRGLMARIEDGYGRWLRAALARRGLVYVGTTVALAAAVWGWRLIPVELAPQSETGEIDVDLEMHMGTNVAVVRHYLDELEALVRNVVPPERIRVVSTEVRGGSAEVELNLKPGNGLLSGAALADRIRTEVEGRIPGANVRVRARPALSIFRRIFRSGNGEESLELELRGWDIDRAQAVSEELQRLIKAVPGITNVTASRREGRPEDNLVLDRERMATLGITAGDLARAVQANVGGVQASRLREGGDEFPIVVRLRPEDRLFGEDLRQITLRTPTGQVVPLSAVVERRRAFSPATLDHVDGQRVVFIEAGVEHGVAVGDALKRIEAAITGVRMPEGFSLSFGGEYLEQQRAQRDFIIAIVLALALVYMLMAAQFERIIDPLVVMLSVPTALVGVVPMLLFTGTTLNIQSVMGLVMLVGIVVNNAIVLVDAMGTLRSQRGLSPAEAAAEAGRLRLRPILMTTLTTVLGLLPLALGIGAGADIQAPLARVVIGGMTASTLVTLVLIPVTSTAAVEVITSWRGRRAKGDDAEARAA